MTEKCFDIGTIQAFLDGELGSDMSEKVACHTAACDVCAIMLVEAEEESAVAFSALESEFNTFVPTNRLWTKINDSIEDSKKTFWQTVFARFSNPSVAAFAGLVIIVGLFASMLSVKPDNDFIANNILSEKSTIASAPEKVSSIQQNPQTASEISETENIKISSPVINVENKPRVVKTAFSEKENSRQSTEIQKASSANNQNAKPAVKVESNLSDDNLLGEESYVKTIATLEKTVESRKDEVLRPAARFAFERDLAVTDDAIKKMRAEVKKNPKNEAAKDVLRASYENKIDLLNSVAEKTELMASLK